jgi:hypothetical protein
MNRDFPNTGQVAGLLVLSLKAPEAAARFLIGLNLPRNILWQLFVLVTILSVLIVVVTQGPAPEPVQGEPAIPAISPMAYTVILGAALVLFAAALQFAGQILGGAGTFEAAMIIVIWTEAVSTVLRILQATILLVIPGSAGLLTILGVGLMIWVLVNFVNALHRFDHLGKALLTIVIATFGIGLALSLVLAVIGTAGAV